MGESTENREFTARELKRRQQRGPFHPTDCYWRERNLRLIERKKLTGVTVVVARLDVTQINDKMTSEYDFSRLSTDASYRLATVEA